MNLLWKEKGICTGDGIELGESLWTVPEYRYRSTEDLKKVVRTTLQQDIEAEVVVIGAGLAGVLTAYLLQQQGISTVVLECNEVGSGKTKNTTAKITSQHGLIYRKLMMYKGEERTWEYAAANQRAIERYEEIIQDLQIDCDYQILPSYIYTLDNESRLKQEMEAAKKVGLPATLTREITLPFPVKAAVKFDHQSQFHPLKFMDALAQELTIYEHTRITEIYKEGYVKTNAGSVKAKAIVMATHYPFINAPGFYFMKMHQERFYLSALEGDTNKTHLDGMYLDADPNGFSFRNYQDYLLLGVGNHRTGQYEPLNAYRKLEEAANRWYPDATMRYQWSNQDCMTPDSIPYIGTFSTVTPNIYVATGFNKWGMTSSMVAALILSDLIRGEKNPYQKVFHPRRIMLSGSRKLLKDAAITTISLLKEALNIPHDKIKEIEAGTAGVVRSDGERIGVYRDLHDRYYYVTTKCPHLGCALEWNQNELTWDCPCHGSRFDYKGNLISNPATQDVYDAYKRRKK